MLNRNDDEKYTSIPNDLLETLYNQKLNGCQYTIIMAIWRFTFGFHRCQHEISAGFLSTATGYNARVIKRELSALVDKGIIFIISNGDRKTNTIKINKDFPKLVTNKSLVTSDQSVQKDSPDNNQLVTNQYTTSDQSVHKLVTNKSPKKKKKENKKESIYVPVQQIVDLYHQICTSYSKVLAISDNRKKHIGARYKQYGCDIEKFRDLFTKAESSDFLKGTNDRNWKADFDWLINEQNMAKVLEGKYTSGRVMPFKKISKNEILDKIFDELEANGSEHKTGQGFYDDDS